LIPLNTAASLSFIGNGTASVFSITFPTFEDGDIVANVTSSTGISTTLVLDVDFSLSNIGKPNTNASFTLINAAQVWLIAGKLKTGYTLTVEFSQNAYQPSKFRDLGRFAPEVFEKGLDRLTMNILALKQSSSSVTTDISDLQDAVADHEGRIVILESDSADYESRISVLEASSSNASTVEIKSTNFTALYNYTYIVTAAVNVQLPAPLANGKITVKVSSTLPVVLVCNGSEKIDFVAANKSLTSIQQAVSLVSDGVDWFII